MCPGDPGMTFIFSVEPGLDPLPESREKNSERETPKILANKEAWP
jgi:hypothetical protein